MSGDTYEVVRFFANRPGERKTLKSGLTLAEAKEHCSDPETQSKTSTEIFPEGALENTGPWFDGFERSSMARHVTVEPPDRSATVDFLLKGHSVVVELDLDTQTDRLRVVTKVIEDGASMWKQDEHEVVLEIKQ